MPKTRERNPNDKIKTKPQTHSEHRKGKYSIAPQIQTAIEEKARQRSEKEEPNEYAATVTEETASEFASGTIRIATNAASTVYSKVESKRKSTKEAQEHYNPDPTNTVSELHTEYADESPSYCPKIKSMEEMYQPDQNPMEVSAVERGRNYTLQAQVTPQEKETEYTLPNQPKTKPDTDYGSQITPKTKAPVGYDDPQPHSAGVSTSSGKSLSVDQGRRLAAQSHMNQQADSTALNQPKVKPEIDYGPRSALKMKAPLGFDSPEHHPSAGLPATNGKALPVEQGRRLAVQSQIKKQSECSQADSVNQHKIKPVRDYGPQKALRTKEAQEHIMSPKDLFGTTASGGKISPVEQGRKLAVDSHRKKRAEKTGLQADYSSISKPVIEYGSHPQGSVQNMAEREGTPSLLPGEQTASGDEVLHDAAPKIRERSKEKLAPKQKPKIEPKTRKRLEHTSTKMVRLERYDRSARVLTDAQKAVEMGRKKLMREAQKQMQQQAKKAATAATNLVRKAAIAIGKALRSVISMLVAAFGGVGAAAILAVILLVGAVLASPFGILFANEPAPDAIPLSSAVAQISMEFSTRLNELQEGEYAGIIIEGAPPDWTEVIAVFACHVAGGDDAVDVMMLDEDKVDRLRSVFWDMCIITVEEDTVAATGPTSPTDSTTELETTLHITIKAKTADEMRIIYAFSNYQNESLDELLAEEEMLNSLIGDLEVSQEDAIALLNNLPGDLSAQRKAVVQQALTLVGKVNYFWGGKSLVIGWDSRWGQPVEVWAAGSPTTGTIRPYGLDCSGFTDWVFYNASGGSYILGHGGGAATQHTYCTNISWNQAHPGDLVFYPDDSHVGIVGGRDEAGNLMVIHCASGRNNVVITGTSGFSSVGCPFYYNE